jgi:hypothetical protein
MSRLTRTDAKLLGLWAILILITLVSLESGRLHGWAGIQRVQGPLVIILAFIKVRLILLDFMEIRHAPLALRLALEGWAGVMCAALIILLFYSP